MREIMDKTQLMEYLGLDENCFGLLFPSPPSFEIAKQTRFKVSEINEWLNEMILAQAKKKERQAVDLYKEANSLLIDKQYAQVEEIICNAIALDRSNPDYHFMLGVCQFFLEKYEDSETELRLALDLAPKAEWRDAARFKLEDMDRMKLAKKKNESLSQTATTADADTVVAAD